MKGLLHFFKLSFQTSPLYMLVMIFQATLIGVKAVLDVYFPKLLIDEITGGRDLNKIFLYGGFILANIVFMQFMVNTLNRYIKVERKKTAQCLVRAMGKKIMNVEYSYLEEPYYLDLKERALFAINNQGVMEWTISNIAETLGNISTLIGLMAIMITLGPVLLIAIAVAAVLMLLCYGIIAKSMVWFQQNLIPINRRLTYYFNLSMGKESQKEIRLYGMEPMITKTILDENKQIVDSMSEMFRKVGVSTGLMNWVYVLVGAFSYVYVGIRTVSNRFGSKLSLGDLTMYVSAAVSFCKMTATTGQNVVGLLQNAAFLKPYLEFMELPEEVKEQGDKELKDDIQTIEFKDVTFTYPKAEKPVLKNVSFCVNAGEKISIVGLNGAGKSTMVKLLCRMFQPDSGVILVNGIDIKDYNYNSYMERISAVFQDYSIFNFSIKENIASVSEHVDEERIQRLIDEVGLREKIEELPDGIDSLFGKEYDEKGIEMSGGQGQKIAIARAIYKKNSGMIILDEPASALDPVAEAEIYEKFNSLTEDKTALYISHRMSSSKFCDRILVLDGGTVADFDTHEHLMKKTDSLYYKLFNAQAENYKIA